MKLLIPTLLLLSFNSFGDGSTRIDSIVKRINPDISCYKFYTSKSEYTIKCNNAETGAEVTPLTKKQISDEVTAYKATRSKLKSMKKRRAKNKKQLLVLLEKFENKTSTDADIKKAIELLIKVTEY